MYSYIYLRYNFFLIHLIPCLTSLKKLFSFFGFKSLLWKIYLYISDYEWKSPDSFSAIFYIIELTGWTCETIIFLFFLNQLSIILIDIFFFIQTFFLLFRFFFFFSLINFIWICFIFSSSMLSEIKFFLSYLVAQTGHNKFSYLIFS